MIYFLNWWLIAFWTCILFALLGGRVFSTQARSAKIGYLIAAGYLIAMLLMWVIPKLFIIPFDFGIGELVIHYLLPTLLVSIFFTRIDTDENTHPPVLDFFYTIFLLLLASIVVLGSFVIEANKINYAECVLNVLFGLALALVLISWLWNPRAGFTGISQIVSRYLLSIGLPFENWVKNIAELAEIKTGAKDFTTSAMQEVVNLPWVSGLTWKSYESEGSLGVKTKYFSTLGFNDFHLSLYTKWPLTPAMTMHVKLLTQILGEFCEAKRREEVLTQNIYMQAVYETGSRLTHDIKNLVQSLSALCSAAEHCPEDDYERLNALIRRQLPLLNQRMARTLEKLEAPRIEKNRMVKLVEWWKQFTQNYSENNINFSCNTVLDILIDADLLDSVIDNLLQNAIEKRKNQQDIIIEVLLNDSDEFLIEVRDSGQGMPESVADSLFKKQISSENGLGIGLYHANKQAQQAGYTLALIENRNGSVRFRLLKKIKS